MKALVFNGQGSLSRETIPDPTPRADEVVVKPGFVQVCITDVLNFEKWPPVWTDADNPKSRQRGGFWPAVMSEGMTPGHEGGGEIVAVGSSVTEFSVGDRISIDSVYRCGECPECRQMLWRDCRVWSTRSNRPGIPTYLGVNSADPASYGRGLMAEFAAVPAAMSYLAPETVSPLANVAMEIGGVTVGSVRASSLQLGDTVVQIGGELYGVYRMQVSRLAGAGTIIYVEANAVRREWAAAHGFADLIIDPTTEDAVSIIRGLFPQGADVVFPSNLVAGSWALAGRIVRKTGTVVPFDADPRLHHEYLDGFDATTLIAEGVRWIGHWPPIASADAVKGGKIRNDHQLFMDFMAQGRIDGAAPVTKVVPFDADMSEIEYAFTSPWRSEVRTAIQVS